MVTKEKDKLGMNLCTVEFGDASALEAFRTVVSSLEILESFFSIRGAESIRHFLFLSFSCSMAI
jgi:hypothetical protein